MICPNCLNDVSDNVPFCPVCGQNLENGRVRRKLRFILMDIQDDRRFRHLLSAIIIIVMVVAFLSVVSVPMDRDGGGTVPSQGPSDSAILIPGTDGYIEFYEGFGGDGFRASLDAEGHLNIRLSSSVSGAYAYFSWVLHNEVTGQNMVVIKETAEISWVFPSVGRYTVIVECSSESGDSLVNVGRMIYFGDVAREDMFQYGDHTYSVNTEVNLKDYLQYSSVDGRRSTSSADEAASFAVVSDPVKRLASRLSDAFIRINPGVGTSGPEFAEFVTTFVQSCIREESDSAVYSASVYWAYPSETLYNGIGDSGDKAVLLAALLKASGYTTGLVLMHGKTFAAVSIDGYRGPSEVIDGMHTVIMMTDGTTYVLVDPSEGSEFGSIPDRYDVRNGRFYYYGAETPDVGGFAAV